MADVLTCRGCGEDVSRSERQSCDNCGHIVREPTVDVPMWEGRAPLRWYVNVNMRSLARRHDLPRFVRLQLRHPWLTPTAWFTLGLFHTLFGLFGRGGYPWLRPIIAVGFAVVVAGSIVQQRALGIAVDELRRHGHLRKS